MDASKLYLSHIGIISVMQLVKKKSFSWIECVLINATVYWTKAMANKVYVILLNKYG